MKRIILFLLVGLSWSYSTAQCKLKYNVNVEYSQTQDLHKIVLEVNGIEEEVNLKLYEIGDPKFPLISEMKLPANSTLNTKVFDQLRPATYLIIASWNQCTETIGGVTMGITIQKNKEK